ncbi:MAG: DUF4040 domain-containing protein [Myxococcota bacterium]
MIETNSIALVFFAFLLVIGVAVTVQRNLFAASMLTGIFSLVSAALFTLMDAVDVAFTEAAVGAGFSTVLFLATLALTKDTEKPGVKRPFAATFVVLLTGGALIYGTLDMPAWGTSEAPIHAHTASYFVTHSITDIGLPNIVTSVLASYRGYDTFGELLVVFTAGTGVTLLMQRKGLFRPGALAIPPKSRAPYVREMPVVRAVAKTMLPFILLFALYVQAHGDFGPGGGFQAGVIFATGFVLYGLIWGPAKLQPIIGGRPVQGLMASGVLLYGGVGVFCLLMGYPFLDYSALTPDHPVHGQHYGIFLVELGVGITVSAVMLIIYFVFSVRPRVGRGAGELGP